jgi:hypothetical protein
MNKNLLSESNHSYQPELVVAREISIMALCMSKRPMTDEECEDICQRQADGLDELLSTKLMGAECLEDLVCSEEDFFQRWFSGKDCRYKG